MGVRIIEDNEGHAALYDSVKDVAFGPVFYSLDVSEVGEYVSAGQFAEAFLRYLPEDARTYSHEALMERYGWFWALLERKGWYGVFGEEVGSGV